MRVEQTQPAFQAIIRRGPTATPAPPRVQDPNVVVDIGVPSVPPAEVLDRVREAAERALAMAADDRELHFRPDPASSRVIVEVRDRRGNVIRTIPPSTALETMTPGIWR